MTDPNIPWNDQFAAALAHLVRREGGYVDLPGNIIRGRAELIELEYRHGDVVRIRVAQPDKATQQKGRTNEGN